MLKHLSIEETVPNNLYTEKDGKKLKWQKAWINTENGLIKVWDITENPEEKYISKIYVATAPHVCYYQLGETYDFTGLVIKAVYSDKSEIDITSDILSQLPTGEIVTTSNFHPNRIITYEGKSTLLNSTLVRYNLDIQCRFTDGAVLIPTLFFDSDYPYATYYYDYYNNPSASQSTHFTDLFMYTYSASTSMRTIRVDFNGTNVNSLAFSSDLAEYVQNIRISENTTRIDNNAFANCNNLSLLYVPHTTEYIGHNAFKNFATSYSHAYVPKTCIVEDDAFPTGFEITYYDRENDIH